MLTCPGCGAEWSLRLAPVGAPQTLDEAPQMPVEAPQVSVEGEKASKNRYQYNDTAFQQFWKVYPRRVGKASAFAKWRIATRDIDPALLIAAAARYARQVQAQGVDIKFVKYPEGWLAGGHWDDEDAVTLVGDTPAVMVVGSSEWQAKQDAEYERIKDEWA